MNAPAPTRLVLLGHPVAHSLSPVFHNAALRAAGLPLRYAALDVVPGALSDVLEGLRQEGAAGNVTIPHKRAVALACAHVTAVARRTGAVNTFWVEGGALCGDNTDVAGFSAAVARLGGGTRASAWPRRIALLGAGGAARAVLAAAEMHGGVTVDVHARTPAHAAALAAEFDCAAVRPGNPAPDAGLVVNATPVGMADDAHPLPLDALPEGAAVLDLVYRPGETAWVRAARARGHVAADGIEMLLEQGALAFERFTGLAPDRDVMRASIAGQ